jgi:hypothetical protein
MVQYVGDMWVADDVGRHDPPGPAVEEHLVVAAQVQFETQT